MAKKYRFRLEFEKIYQTLVNYSLWFLIELSNWIFMSENPAPRFGFVHFAETWNGRLAMMGIVIGLSTELLTGQGILGQMGIG